MTSLLSSESLDDFTSLTLIAIAHSPQPIAGFQTAFVQHGNLLLARKINADPYMMIFITDRRWFCQFWDQSPGYPR